MRPARARKPLVFVTVTLVLAACGYDWSIVPKGAPPGSDEAGTTSDGGTDGTGEPSDASVDAVPDGGRPSCALQPFDSLVAVSAPGEFKGSFRTPRLAGPNIYFAAAEETLSQDLFVANNASAVPGGPPSLLSAARIAVSDPELYEWAPTAPDDEAFLVFARGVIFSRELWLGLPSEGSFVAARALAELNSGTDQADPYLAGPAGRTLYWSRDGQPAGRTIFRAPTVTFVSGQPTFGTPSTIGLTCPETQCGTPVVTPDESILFFGSYTTGDDPRRIHEVRLAPTGDGGVTVAGMMVSHPELGERQPTWISKDGCALLVAGYTLDEVRFARRTPK